MTPHTGYPSGPSDERWELTEPVLAAWRAWRRRDALDIGRAPGHDLRQSMSAWGISGRYAYGMCGWADPWGEGTARAAGR
ncbi:hypothetical protein [Streptomyces sp. NPDC055189]